MNIRMYLMAALVSGLTIVKAQSNLGVGTPTPHASAKLDVSSSTQGMLVPRMDSSQRVAIAAPATGLLVYQNNATAGFWYFNGTSWVNLGAGSKAFFKVSGTNPSFINYNDSVNYGKNFLINADSINYDGSGDDYKAMFIPGKFATRMGDVDNKNWDLDSIGIGSFATGYNTKAKEGNSFASGDRTTASGYSSTAMGYFTLASGFVSTALGNRTTASGSSATAMGSSTVASGSISTAMGSNTVASGNFSFAAGFQDSATGTYSVALGNRTKAIGVSATSMGNQTIATGAYSMAQGDNTVASGSTAVALGQQSVASGRNAIAMGFLDSANGPNSVALGTYSKATGDYSTSIGLGPIASGSYSTAIGYQTLASGDYSTAIGIRTKASGSSSTAMGGSTTASGNTSTAMGLFTSATGDGSTAMGNTTTAKSYVETVVGSFNTDYTPASTTGHNISDRAFGVGIGTGTAATKDGFIVYKDGTLSFNKLTTAPATTTDRLYILNNKVYYNGAEAGGVSELQKLTEGGNTGYRILGRNASNYGNIGTDAVDLSTNYVTSSTLGATGTNSLAVGQGTTASGLQSIAMGKNTSASGDYSYAMGFSASAQGLAATAIGNAASAAGNISTAMGEAVITRSFAETAVGSFNTIYTPVSTTAFNSADRAFGVGIGDAANRKDGLIVYKDGTLSFNKLTTAPATTTDRLYILNNKVHYNGAELGGGASELQKVIEGGNTGYRLLGRDAANYGNIGAGAIDLSESISASGTAGATGIVAVAMGTGTTASGNRSTAFGVFTTASGNTSTAMGNTTIASGDNTTALGIQTTARSYGELAIGQFNDQLTSVNANAWGGDANRVFTVGNGTTTTNRSTAFVIQQNGRVGIGTNNTTLTKALLEVNGSASYNAGATYGWYNVGTSGTSSTGPQNYSIWASQRIAANEFNAFSDARIKNIAGLSSNANDLVTLSKIRITNYTMKDNVQYGNKAFKKVIAQELIEVYPQAVNISSNIIPDIYQKATASNGWITLKTDLVKGDMVKIITANSTTELMVEAVANDKFKVATADGEVFVYGKQVSDFHTVDYEALSTLNISATQALLQRIIDLETKNASLSSQIKQMETLKSEIEAIKSKLNIGAISIK